jgi:nicotinamidase/pyrazinamidase
MVTTLLIVDGQKDFHPGGSLSIPTANDDADRIAALIRTHGSKIDRIVATLDSHHKLDIAHPGFWRSSSDDNKRPDPFTIISSQDIQNGIWKPFGKIKVSKTLLDPDVFSGLDHVMDGETVIDLTKYAIEYTKRLEEKGRFQLCIWPEHCLIGSPGHAVVDVIREALNEWGDVTGGSVEWVLKGMNVLTEGYSALEAEVPVDKTTTFDWSLQKSLIVSDRLLVCGQAMSHCVNFTLRDVAKHWPSDKLSNITLLTDCASAVPGFEAAAETFQNDMAEMGVVLQKAADVFA